MATVIVAVFAALEAPYKEPTRVITSDILNARVGSIGELTPIFLALMLALVSAVNHPAHDVP
jgi:hypothetical protein